MNRISSAVMKEQLPPPCRQGAECCAPGHTGLISFWLLHCLEAQRPAGHKINSFLGAGVQELFDLPPVPLTVSPSLKGALQEEKSALLICRLSPTTHESGRQTQVLQPAVVWRHTGLSKGSQCRGLECRALGSQQAGGMRFLPLNSCVSLGKVFNFSDPFFLCV